MNEIIIKELENNDFLGMDIFEISEIPDISILIKETDSEKDFVLKHKKEFETIISEFFFGCKRDFNSQYENQDYSISLVFKSEKVENQTYNANIKVYIILRAINQNKEYLISKMKELENSLINSLDNNKYGIKKLENKEEIINEIKVIANKEKRVITKDYQMNNLQSMYFPECFTFDKFPNQNENFTKIFNILMQYPNTEIIIDLIPTVLNANEINNLETYSSTLDIISKGAPGPEGGVANILAEKPAELYKYYESNKYSVLFAYNILICAEYNYINTISTKIDGELSLGQDREYAKLKEIEIGNYELDVDTYFDSLPWVINEITIDKNVQNAVCGNSNAICNNGRRSK